MSLEEPIATPFGCGLAPINLTAVQAKSKLLHQQQQKEKDSDAPLLKPRYTDSGYVPKDWLRSTHLIPAAWPRSSYSSPLAGGTPQDELPTDTYERLKRDPKNADSMPFFSQTVPPSPNPFRIGVQDPRGEAEASSMPALVIERLVPRRRCRDQESGKVLILAHGLGSCKETFLPLLDDLVGEEQHDIDQVWLIDALGHGVTSNYNNASTAEEILSSKHRVVDSNDYARDLLLFLTCFLPTMLDKDKDDSKQDSTLNFSSPRLPPRKVIGIGHSFGGTALLQVAVHLSPLFESLAIIEPILFREEMIPKAARIPLARFTLMKRDSWPSREEALQDMEKDRMTSSWDPRVRQAFIAGGVFQKSNDGAVMRCCDRVAESLCIRGNRPGFQLGMGTMRHLLPTIKVLYVSCHKPLLLSLEEVKSMAQQIPFLDFQTLKGSHSLPHEFPSVLAGMIRRSLLQPENSDGSSSSSKL